MSKKSHFQNATDIFCMKSKQSRKSRSWLQLPAAILELSLDSRPFHSNLAVHFFLGCLLHIYYESDSDCEYVATLDCDPDTLSTFELTLTLRQDAGRRSWRKKLPELVRLDPV